MVVVSVLVALGMKVGSAIDLVRAARPGTIRNPAQIFYVKLFSQAWHQKHPPGPLNDEERRIPSPVRRNDREEEERHEHDAEKEIPVEKSKTEVITDVVGRKITSFAAALRPRTKDIV